jgi:hypothetical protein
MKTYGGGGCIDPSILDLGTSWRLVVSFTSWLLYPRENSPRYALDRRLGVPQSRSGRRVEERHLAPYRDSKSDPLGLPAHSPPVSIWTVLSRIFLNYISGLQFLNLRVMPLYKCVVVTARKLAADDCYGAQTRLMLGISRKFQLDLRPWDPWDGAHAWVHLYINKRRSRFHIYRGCNRMFGVKIRAVVV